VLAALVVAVVVLVADPARAADPRGANRVYDAPGGAHDASAKVVSLTFDDGPHPTFTPRVLDVLRAKGVQATFFMIGRQAERYPELVQQVAAAGHLIGNHTWNHAHLQGLPEDRFAFEVDHTRDVLESISGQQVVCTRPPYGDARPDTVQRLADHGQASVVWSADSEDFDKPGVDAIVRNALEHLGPGSIVLMHDGGGNRDQTIAALPRIIDEIRARGYQIVPVCDGREHRPSGYLDAVDAPEPESVHVAGWVKDPDSDGAPPIRVTIDGTTALDLPAAIARTDGRWGFDVELPAEPGERRVCATAGNLGLGHDVALGCWTVPVAEAPWFDRMARRLGLLAPTERFEAPSVLQDPTLVQLVELLVPPDDGT
jgi:peptidoglycan/xylan/chitin deacetylase (PgdA/CDA1 family)